MQKVDCEAVATCAVPPLLPAVGSQITTGFNRCVKGSLRTLGIAHWPSAMFRYVDDVGRGPMNHFRWKGRGQDWIVTVARFNELERSPLRESK